MNEAAMLRRRLCPTSVFVAALLVCGRAAAQTPFEYYDQNCAACHTIGQGAVNGGPDLNDVTRRRSREWLIKFLLNPESLASDPVVIQLIKDSGGVEMPKPEGLTREMAEALLDVIEQRSVSGATPAAEPAARAITAADVAHGQDVFLGRTPLSARGPACVHCHDLATLAAPGGGRFGPDLTAVHSRLGGARGIAGWLRAAPTPVMRSVYQSASLTADEVHALSAVFEDAAVRTDVQRRSRLMPLVGGSIGMTLLVLAVIGWAGAGRFRGVRSALVARPLKRPTSGGSE